MTLEELNGLPRNEAMAALRACCGAERWVDAMAECRPFKSVPGLLDAADEIWRSLQPNDWREAFAHHPRIGQRTSRVSQSKRARDWSSGEQRGMGAAAADVREQLAAVNAEYEQRFGYIYIVCATGKSADELLGIARDRLDNAPDMELRVAAEEQRKITRLRLEKLLAEEKRS